jgi:hypothetical protein
MYCLIQFYIQLKEDLAPHRPFMKVLCIKLVIFFCFWQSWIISLLTADSGPLKATKQIAGPDLRIGIPSMLTCVEMSIFAILHLFAFPWKPYDLAQRHEPLPQAGEDTVSEAPKKYAHGPARALISTFNPWDIVKACGRGFRWLVRGIARMILRTKRSSTLSRSLTRGITAGLLFPVTESLQPSLFWTKKQAYNGLITPTVRAFCLMRKLIPLCQDRSRIRTTARTTDTMGICTAIPRLRRPDRNTA